MRNDTKYVAYYRVSTVRQGTSGLGLDAQQQMVMSFANGGSTIIKEFTEVESGKNDSRIQLKLAIEYALQNEATLLIAKLDRLSRNANFILKLRDSNVKFIAADMPDANNFTIGLIAIIAQHEREQISERTRNALKIKKQRGEKLGTPENLTEEARNNALKARIANAVNNPANQQATELIFLYKQSGLNYDQIACKLNMIGLKTRTGKKYRASTVWRLYSRKINRALQ